MKKIICAAFFFLFWSYCPVCAGSVSNLAGVSLSSCSWSLSWSIPSVSTPTIVLSTNSDYSMPVSSGTGTLWQDTTSYTNLEPNTTYYFEVKNSTEPDGYVKVDTITFAAIPSGLTVDTVYKTSVTISWSPNGNPGYTPYEVSYSLDDFQLNFSTIPFSAGLKDNTTIYSLTEGTTYYIRVRAQNGDKIAGGFSTVVSTPTYPKPLSGLDGVGASPLSISWSWNSSGGGATKYNIFRSTDSHLLYTTGDTEYVQSGLSTNTAHGIMVQPFTSSWSQPLSEAVTVYTLAAVPKDATFDPVSISTISLYWNENGNPGDTLYQVNYSTAGPIHTMIPFSAGFKGNTTAFYNLFAGTTYSFCIMARNNDTPPQETGCCDVSTVTHPTPLIGLSTESVNVTSIKWSWNSSGGPATKYNVFPSTGGSPLATTADAHYEPTGLSTNTVYSVKVQPFTSSWKESLSEAVTAYTLAAVPSDPAVDAVYQSSVTISWSTNTNPSGTHYTVRYAPDELPRKFTYYKAYADNLIEDTTAVYGLKKGTTYFFGIASQNLDEKPGIGGLIFVQTSTVTHPSPLIGLAGYALGVSSMIWNWNSSGGAATRYKVYSASSELVLANISTTTFTLTGISTNTAQGIKVQPFTSSWTQPLSNAVTVYTLAAPPLVESFPGVYVTSITVQWESNGNPPGTPYELSYSTDNLKIHFSTPVLFAHDLTATTTDLLNLQRNTTYYIRLRAQNHHSTVTAFTNLDPVCTLANAPGAVAVTLVSSKAVSIIWGKNDNPGYTPYEITYTTINFQTNFSTYVPFADNLIDNNTTIYNLIPGTTYYIRVRAQNHTLETTDFVFISTQTLGAQVVGLTGFAQGVSSITWIWDTVIGAGSYNIYQATNPAILLSSTDSTSFVYTGLSTNTAYGIAVAAVTSGEGQLSEFSTVYTSAAPPADTWANVVSSTIIKVFWDNNTNPPWTEYEVSYSSLPFSSGGMISTASLTVDTTQNLSSLIILTTYYTRVRAFNGDGSETSFDNVSSTRTYPAPTMRPYPFSLLLPADGVYQSPLDIKLVWEHSESPLGHDITYTVGYSTCPDFSCSSKTVITGYESYQVSTSSPGYTYYWKVSAIDSTDSYIRRDSSSSFRFIVSTSQVNSPDGSVYVDVISEFDGFVTIEEIKASDKDILKNANRLAARERRYHILQDRAYLIAVKNASKEIISVDNLNARLTFDYSSDNGYYQGSRPSLDLSGSRSPGPLRGSLVKVDYIQIARLDENSGQWEILPHGATLDRQNKKVTGRVDRFSYFTLLGSVIPSSVLSGARNFPNPFQAGREETTIQYTLTENAKVTLKIYTPFGDLVLKKEFESGSEGGRGQPTGYPNKISWDGRNGAGKIVANGIYVCKIEAKTSGGRKKITRLIGVKK